MVFFCEQEIDFILLGSDDAKAPQANRVDTRIWVRSTDEIKFIFHLSTQRNCMSFSFSLFFILDG